jgi:mannose-6-phosphate isomerase-like protein (cupin superfamily)
MEAAGEPVSSIETLEWVKFRPLDPTSFEFKVNLIASEYTTAYSVDLVRVPVGGFSPPHTDPDNHAFYILAGRGAITIDGRIWNVGPGSVVKIPVGIVHSVTNSGDVPLEFLTIYDPPRPR